jgi:patatin-like phospholipase
MHKSDDERNQLNWRQFTRSAVVRDKSWKPCICIQGGGARGAWEAGVLAGLLDSAKTQPVVIWGTSAGAINALWASTLPPTSSSDRLIDLWCSLSRRIVVSVLSLAAILIFWLVVMLIFHTILVASCIVAISVFSTFAFVWMWGRVNRLPGLIPLWIAARLLPQNHSPARWHSYFCTANVNLEKPPQTWSWDTLSCFCLKPGSTLAELLTSTSKRPFDPRLAAMASAAFPIMFRPLFVGDKEALLDGGLEVNLPAGHIFSQGMSGGHCAICIVPMKLANLDPQDHVDYRVLRFLSDMKVKQSNSRDKLRDGQNVQVNPAHALRPILIVCPIQVLRSGMLKGLYSRKILKSEFEQGRRDSEELLKAMSAFESGETDALQEYLLENRQLPVITDLAPKAGCWKYWANLKWP